MIKKMDEKYYMIKDTVLNYLRFITLKFTAADIIEQTVTPHMYDNVAYYDVDDLKGVLVEPIFKGLEDHVDSYEFIDE